jgi:DNA polymerase-1
MENSLFPFPVEITITAEADDLFGFYAYQSPDKVVIYTDDKDMRMLPGLHLTWRDHRMHRVDHTGEHHIPTDSTFNDKQYGWRWFWLQMLQGDTADNIPGLPKYATTDAKGNPCLKPIGEVTADAMLDGKRPYFDVVADLYIGYYHSRWVAELLEQAILLWMRRWPSGWDDVLQPGSPLELLHKEKFYDAAYLEILKRVDDANAINSAAQGN